MTGAFTRPFPHSAGARAPGKIRKMKFHPVETIESAGLGQRRRAVVPSVVSFFRVPEQVYGKKGEGTVTLSQESISSDVLQIRK
jgi:hypothetical protein